jgi:glucosamine--fructose-6-phosphate aminotransferase (isomerizing)
MSILEHEIISQPQVLQSLLEAECAPVQSLVDRLRGRFAYVVIAARGTSDNAARYAQYLFGARNQLPVALTTPSLFSLYHQPPRLDHALVIGISQSGQSPDIVAVVAEARRQGRPTLAITNDRASPLAAQAEHVIDLHAGPELAVAATKTYTASLGALALFSCLLAGDTAALEQLRAIPERLQATLQAALPVLPRVERYRYMAHCAVIGRGYNYATTFEVALKIKELTRIVAEPYSSADFRHGPIALARHGFPVLVIAPGGIVSPDIFELSVELRRRASELIVISDDPQLLQLAHLALPMAASLPEHLSPLAAVVPGQLFSLALAQARGLDPDQPEGLRKVTETL